MTYTCQICRRELEVFAGQGYCPHCDTAVQLDNPRATDGTMRIEEFQAAYTPLLAKLGVRT